MQCGCRSERRGRSWQYLPIAPPHTSLLIDFKHMVSSARSFLIDLGRKLVNNCIQLRWCSLATLVLAGLGCAEDTSIRQYTVAKSETQRNSATANRSSTAAPASKQLMLAAIVPNQDFAWFFKLTGDPEKVLKSDAEFRSMVKSVAFDGAGQPTWKLHEGWQQQITPEAITYGKLTNDEAGLTATVTRLPFTSNASEDSWRGYIVSNINRWRNQLSLGQQEWEQMSRELEEFPELSQGAAKAYFVSIAGTGSGGMDAPFMNRGAGGQPPPAVGGQAPTANASSASGATTPDTAAPPKNAAASKPITYQVPQGWQEEAASGMRMASFAVSQAGAEGEVTVIAAGGGIEANIGIWLGQVGMESKPETTARILAEAQDVTVHEVAAKLYTIGGPAATPAANQTESSAESGEESSAESGSEAAVDAEVAAGTASDTVAAKAAEPSAASDSDADADADSDADASETILIADIPWRDGQSLFVKFKGPTSLASSQRAAFIAFVESIEWN